MDSHEQKAEDQALISTVSEKVERKSSSTQISASGGMVLLPEVQGSVIIHRKASEHFTKGNEAMEKAEYERAVTCFSKAINLQPEQPRLYVSQAAAYLQLCDFQSAAACYKRACILQPGSFCDRLAFVYYLQGQCLFDRGLCLDALEAFTKAAEVKPGCRAHAVRSLACLAAAGRLSDCLRRVNDWTTAGGPTSDLYVLRARLHKQLNQNSLCYHDVKSALALDPTCPEAAALLLQLHEASERARRKAVDRALMDQLPQALCMIGVALDNCPQDARLHLFRGTLYRRLTDFPAAIEDLVQAMELSEVEMENMHRGQTEAGPKEEDHGALQKEVEFQLVLTYNDFAVQCFRRGLYAEATSLLNKAIEGEKGQAELYLNRGDCFFKQSDWCYALADYQQAEEMQPDDAAARLRLGVVHNTLGSLCFQDGRFHDAASMFTEAIRHNPTASQYYENRAKAFRKVLNWEGAQKDLICTLMLDPSNEELPPMLMNLFPGSSTSDVLSSPAAQTVRVQLMETIQAFNSLSDQKSMTEKFQQMTVTNQNTVVQSEHPPEEEELKLCVSRREVLINLKIVQQVKETTTLHPPPPSMQSH